MEIDIKGTFSKLQNTSTITNTNTNTILYLLTQFPFHQVQEMNQIYFCDGFKLYSAVYVKDLETKYMVYLIEINYFDETFLTNINNKPIIEKLINEKKSNNPYVLERLGIYYDADKNLFYLIYNKEKKKLFIQESCLNFLQQEETKILLKLQVFYNYCQIVKIEHSNQREMSIIHPFLLFSDNDSIYTIDHALTILKPCINNYSNISILYYYGLFDLDIIEKLELSEEKETDLYLKPDILLLCALLVYLYRPMITKSSFNFDLILLEISKDFTYKDKSKRLNKLISLIRDNEYIKRICSSVLSVDYSEISDIERLIKQVIKHFANVSLLDIQCNCDISLLFKEANPMLNLICIDCGTIKCPKCEKETVHSCQEDKNKFMRLKEKLKFEYEILTSRFDNITEIKEKKIIESFVDTIKKIYAEFEDKNNASSRKIKMIEDFIENFSNYVNEKIKSYDGTKFEELQKEIRALKDTSNINARPSTHVTSQKFYKKLLSNRSIQVEKDDLNLKDKWELLSKEIDEFSSFLKDSSELMNVLLYDRSIQQITQVAKARMIDFQRLINEEYFDKYWTCFNEIINTMMNLYTNNGFTPVCSNNLLNEYLLDRDPNNKFYYKKYFVFYSNSIALYDVEAKSETEIQLELIDGDKSQPISISLIGKNYRYLHLKSGIMITGGKGIKKAYFINYDGVRENVHLVKQLPDLETVHEKHMMVSFNTFNVIVIGGIDNSTCEMYNFAYRKWESLPSLHSPCFDACVFLYNFQYVYVFGGMKTLETFSNTIKILDMNNIEAQWVTKKIIYGDNALQNFRLCGLKRIADDKKSILIYGGETTTGNTFEAIELVQKFDFESSQLEIFNENSKPYSYEECLLLEIGPNEFNI